MFPEDESFVFSFLLRRADDTQLGLETVGCADGLLVTDIVAGSAIDAWNRQVVTGPGWERAVVPGDRIVRVNKETGLQKMFEECSTRLLLRLFIMRSCVDFGSPWNGWQSSHATEPHVPVWY